MNKNPKVAINCITYNHKNYITQALEGIINQKTNFPFVVYVGDDCSTDGTKEIIEEYQKKYPDIIKPIFHDKNTEGYENYIDTINACKAEYVAFCEGDDYWIDNSKLQKQVDYMDSHKNCTVCFHPSKITYEGIDKKDEIFPSKKMLKGKRVLSFDDLLEKNYIQTNTVMYRWRFNDKDYKNYFSKDMIPGDWYMHLLHAKDGEIHMLKDVMGVYRRHQNGIWILSLTDPEKLYLKYGLKMAKFYYNVYKKITNSSQDYLNNVLLINLLQITKIYLKNLKIEELQKLKDSYPVEIKEALKLLDKKETNKIKKYKRYSKLFLTTSVILLIALIFIIIYK